MTSSTPSSSRWQFFWPRRNRSHWDRGFWALYSRGSTSVVAISRARLDVTTSFHTWRSTSSNCSSGKGLRSSPRFRESSPLFQRGGYRVKQGGNVPSSSSRDEVVWRAEGVVSREVASPGDRHRVEFQLQTLLAHPCRSPPGLDVSCMERSDTVEAEVLRPSGVEEGACCFDADVPAIEVRRRK